MFSPSRSSGYMSLVLLFFLTRLPRNAFSVFLTFYFSKTLLRTFVWGLPADRQDSLILRTSDLFWSSLFLLILPYLLFGVALLLQASSCSIIQFSRYIPYQNATAAFALECILLFLQRIKELYVQFELYAGILIGASFLHREFNRKMIIKSPKAPRGILICEKPRAK